MVDTFKATYVNHVEHITVGMVVYTMLTPMKRQTQTFALTYSTVLDVLNVSDSKNTGDHESDNIIVML